jgi:hypothetical protein
MKVYWAPLDNKEMNLTLAYYEPSRLANNIPVDLRDSGYYKCPAFMETVKNTFALKSPISLDMDFNPSKQLASAGNENLFNLKARIDDATDHRFNTDEKIELVNFDVTPKIEEIADSCLQMKQSGHKSSFSLDFCYKSFIMYKRNKALMREIEAQGL